MPLSLVVVTPFSTYKPGDIISDTNAINAIRTSEHYSQVVMVSDEPIPEPEPPPPPPDFYALQAAWREQQALIDAQQTALASQIALNTSQTTQISNLTASLLALEAKVNGLPGGGTPLPPNLADDKPLAEDDNVVLSTDSGAVLAGDIR